MQTVSRTSRFIPPRQSNSFMENPVQPPNTAPPRPTQHSTAQHNTARTAVRKETQFRMNSGILNDFRILRETGNEA